MLAEKITVYYRAQINSQDPDDPLAKMVIYSEKETKIKAGELDDPIGDGLYQRRANGRLIHRHADRALLLLTDRCAAHCRYCFRRKRVGWRAADITPDEFGEVLKYIAAHREIKEIILSGGDPLSLPDERLLEIINALKKAGSCSIRLHTRYPVYDPSRCKDFGRVAAQLDTIVVHVNHHREITTEFCRAAAVLRAAKFLLNQSVLLKEVNDFAQELMALSYALGAAGILPYYLHYPDLAAGISHFRIPLDDAVRLVQSLQGQLPGYLIPRLMLDIPNGKGKVVLGGDGLRRSPDGACLITAPLTGETVAYREIL
ncbi:MAG: KamA family radical SAM protein [Kiritimatiellae bacterium]|nr:KamA family radical SAM protein [Kiritimatiellia bacterium]